MSAIFALAGMSAADYQYVHTAGEQLIYEATRAYTAQRNADIQRAESAFIEMMTENHNERYKLPGTGRMARRTPGTRGPAVRAYGGWDVAYPLYDFEEAVVGDDVDLAYMTPQEYQNHIDTIVNRYVGERRWQILHALLDDQAGSSESFTDRLWGTLTIVPLANGDSVTYPPVLGSDSEATEDHYAESGYAAASISDTNNPIETNVNELVEHFGTTTGGENVISFINNAQTTQVKDLTDFTEVEDRFIRSGDNVDVPFNLPNVPGKIIGRTNGSWVSEWRWIPANYILSIHMEAPAPLKERVDPAATGLPRGLNLVAQDDTHPLMSSIYRARFGIAVGNRLNGCVMELGTGGTYTIPTAYT